MEKRLAVGIVVFSMLVSACASTSSLKPRNYERIRLQDEANEFYNAWRDKNAEKIWQLSSPFLKKDNRKEEYIANLKLYLEFITDFDYSRLAVVYISRKFAVTQAHISIKFKDKYGEIDDLCERSIWLRFPEGWRFQEANLVCNYMPDQKRIKFLTKNIPDR